MTPAKSAGALLLLFDVAATAIAEHDEWHTHEHMPERLAIPGFLRGTRWTRVGDGPRYCVLYEVEAVGVLASPAYRERLDHPSPWTARMMPHYRGMRRSLCDVVAGEGSGIGGSALVIGFAPMPGRDAELRGRLLAEVLPGLAARRGLAAWRLLEATLPAAMTREQALRGRDTAVHSALWVTGYDEEALAAVATSILGPDRLLNLGAADAEHAHYRLAHLLAVPGR